MSARSSNVGMTSCNPTSLGVRSIEPDPTVIPGSHQDHRHSGRPFIHGLLGPHVVVAEHVAVIGREHDDGVIENTLLTDCADHGADFLVDMRAECVERAPCPPDFALRIHATSLHCLEEIGEFVRHPGPVAAKGRIDFDVAVVIEKPLRRHERRMRVAKAEIPEARPRGIAPTDGSLQGVSRPIRRVNMFRQVPGGGLVRVVAHAVPELLPDKSLVAKEDLVVVGYPEERSALIVEKHIIEADAIPLRVGVGLADGIGLVAVVAKGLGECRQIRIHAPLWLKRSVAVGACGRPGHDCPAGRQAHRRLGIAIRVSNSVPAQGIQHRRVNRGMSRRAEQGGRPVVRDDQQNVGSGHVLSFPVQNRNRAAAGVAE